MKQVFLIKSYLCLEHRIIEAYLNIGVKQLTSFPNKATHFDTYPEAERAMNENNPFKMDADASHMFQIDKMFIPF